MKRLLTAAGGLLCLPAVSSGQSLWDFGSRFDEKVRMPFSLRLSSAAGWDSRPGASSASRDGNNEVESGGSAFWRNSIVLHYPLELENNRFDFDLDYSNTWYEDPPPGTRRTLHTGHAMLNYQRGFSPRLTIGNTAQFSHQGDPNFDLGATILRPTRGYSTGSNRLWAEYKWGPRFSTTTSYSFNAITYDEDSLKSENYITHTFGETFRYALTARTTSTFDYRYSFTRYPDNDAADSQSNYLLLGVERPIGRFFSATVKGGVEFRSYDGPLGNINAPTQEVSLNYLGLHNTTFSAFYRGGLEAMGRPGSQSNLTRRAGVRMTHHFTPTLSMNIGLDGVSTDYSKGTSGQRNEKLKTFHDVIGLRYSRPLGQRLRFDADYSFSMISSDDPLNEYSRHLFSLGVSGNF